MVTALARLNGVRPAFNAPCVHEAVIALDRPVAPVLKALESQGILGGLNLTDYYPELGNARLVCATETKTTEDIQRYASALSDAMKIAAAA